jgi:hypothetical protein
MTNHTETIPTGLFPNLVTLQIEPDTDFNLKDMMEEMLGKFYSYHKHYKTRFNEEATGATSTYLKLSVYAYIHSGIALSTTSFNDRWDSGVWGYVWVSMADIEKEYGTITPETLERARDVLKAEVDTLSSLLNGDVWGYTVLDTETQEQLDSCWGIIGYDYVVESGKEAAKSCQDALLLRECKDIDCHNWYVSLV